MFFIIISYFCPGKISALFVNCFIRLKNSNTLPLLPPLVTVVVNFPLNSIELVFNLNSMTNLMILWKNPHTTL